MDNQIEINDKFIDELSEEYANYFKLDTSPQVKLIEESIEENLTHLEEFCTMIDLIRSENNKNLSNLLPDLKEKRDQLKIVYSKIDKLLELVDSIKKTVDLMDDQLTKAELKFNTSNKLSKFISNLIGTSSSIDLSNQSNNQISIQFEPPLIFKTKDYFE